MDAKKQTVTLSKQPSVTGKKRKKKKIRKEKEESSKEHDVSKKDKESTKLESAITISKIETLCSSSSSIESQRPVIKLARIEQTSTDSITKNGNPSAVSSSSDVPMDSISNHSSSNASENIMQGTIIEPPTLPQSSSLTISSSNKTHGTTHRDPLLQGLSLTALASLRWIEELSDEEKERERLEDYKHNRRERYKKDLVLRNERKPPPYSHSSVTVK